MSSNSGRSPVPWDDPDSDPLQDVRDYIERLLSRPMFEPKTLYFLHCHDCWAAGPFLFEHDRDRWAGAHRAATGHHVTTSEETSL